MGDNLRASPQRIQLGAYLIACGGHATKGALFRFAHEHLGVNGTRRTGTHNRSRAAGLVRSVARELEALDLISRDVDGNWTVTDQADLAAWLADVTEEAADYALRGSSDE